MLISILQVYFSKTQNSVSSNLNTFRNKFHQKYFQEFYKNPLCICLIPSILIEKSYSCKQSHLDPPSSCKNFCWISQLLIDWLIDSSIFYLFIYLFIYLYIYLFIYLFIHLFIYFFILYCAIFSFVSVCHNSRDHIMTKYFDSNAPTFCWHCPISKEMMFFKMYKNWTWLLEHKIALIQRFQNYNEIEIVRLR